MSNYEKCIELLVQEETLIDSYATIDNISNFLEIRNRFDHIINSCIVREDDSRCTHYDRTIWSIHRSFHYVCDRQTFPLNQMLQDVISCEHEICRIRPDLKSKVMSERHERNKDRHQNDMFMWDGLDDIFSRIYAISENENLLVGRNELYSNFVIPLEKSIRILEYYVRRIEIFFGPTTWQDRLFIKAKSNVEFLGYVVIEAYGYIEGRFTDSDFDELWEKTKQEIRATYLIFCEAKRRALGGVDTEDL